MKRLIFMVFIVAVAAASYLYKENSTPSASAPSSLAREGSPAPDFVLSDLQGRQVRLSDYRGKVVLLNFWATWCPPCVEEIPSMERLHQLMKGKDFVMLALNVEPNGPQVVPGFLRNNSATFPILFDDQKVVQKEYGVFRFPETFIIDKQGIIEDNIIGGRNWDDKTIVEYLEMLMRGAN